MLTARYHSVPDPFFRRRNVARSLSHSQVFEYIIDRLRAAYMYFGLPQTKQGPLFNAVDQTRLEVRLQQSMRRLEDESSRQREGTQGRLQPSGDAPTPQAPSTPDNSAPSDDSSLQQFVSEIVDGILNSAIPVDELNNHDAQLRVTKNSPSHANHKASRCSPDSDSNTLFDMTLLQNLREEDLHFVFTAKEVIDGKVR